LAAAAVCFLSLAAPYRVRLAPPWLPERRQEEEVGRALRRFPNDEPVVLSTTDYGYFAIQAAAGSPHRFAVTETHDPRDRGRPLPVPPRVRELARRKGARLAVVPLCVELADAEVLHTTEALKLLRLPAL